MVIRRHGSSYGGTELEVWQELMRFYNTTNFPAPSDFESARQDFLYHVTFPDPHNSWTYVAPISNQEAIWLAGMLLKTSNVCTKHNVSQTARFVHRRIMPSLPRRIGLFNYMIALSKSSGPRDLTKRVDTTELRDANYGLGSIVKGKPQQPPQPAYKRLHLVYIALEILKDTLSLRESETKNDQDPWDSPRYSMDMQLEYEIVDSIRDKIFTLMQLAACPCSEGGAKVIPQLLRIVTLFKECQVFSSAKCDEMQHNVLLAERTTWEKLVQNLAIDRGNRAAYLEDQARREVELRERSKRRERHGVPDDPYAPWHELPATNAYYQKLIRGYPLRADALPQGGYPVNQDGATNEGLVKEDTIMDKANDLYQEVLHCFDKHTDSEKVQDIDALGNIIWKDPDRPTRNYWGFTLEGCDQIRQTGIKRSADSLARLNGASDGVNSAVERARLLAGDTNRGISMSLS